MSSDSECSDYSYTSDEEDYNFDCVNVDPSLAKILGLKISDEQKPVENNWVAPKFSGLENSSKINNGKIIEFDNIIEKINMKKKLSSEELEFVGKISNDKKQILIELFNSNFK